MVFLSQVFLLFILSVTRAIEPYLSAHSLSFYYYRLVEIIMGVCTPHVCSS